MLQKWGEWPLRLLSVATAVSVTAGSLLVATTNADAATVTVQPGDTLSAIAVRYHVSLYQLAAVNHLSDPDYVQAGWVLELPAASTSATSNSAPVTVLVGLGQTLTAIAARYGVSVAALASANGISNPNYVQAGTRLRIPASGMSLASYSVAVGGLPAGLAAHPARLALQPDFASAAANAGVPETLLEALCWWESGWQSSIISATGAIGVCQIEPSTAALVNGQRSGPVLDPYVPEQNIALGAIYLASLLRQTGGDQSLALAGYYQGLTSVRRSGMFPSTVTYVHGIEAYARIFAG